MLINKNLAAASLRLTRMMSHVSGAESAAWREIRIPVPWGHIAGKEWGNANGVPVLGLHGWQDNSATFDRLAPLLPLSQLRFIALDLPGHGHSSHLLTGSWYRWSDYVHSVQKVVNYLNWNRFSILAHSMSGKVGYIYAASFPERIDKLITIDMPRPMPGVSNVLFNDPKKHYHEWVLPDVYRDWYEHILKVEKSSSQSSNIGRTMDQLLDKLLSVTAHYLTRDSARVILSRGTRLVGENPNLYVLTRDRRVEVYDFMLLDEHLDQVFQHVNCDLLLIIPKEGLMLFHKDIDLSPLNKLKNRLETFQLEYVDGTHHCHLNTPESVASIIRKEWGNPKGEPFLGLHGWQDNSATYDRLAPLLPLNQLRFVAIDFPGHGHSSHLPPGMWYRWNDYIASIARVTDYLKWKSYSIIAHSMGAKASFLYAGCFPEQIKRLISLDVMRPFPGGSRILLEHQEGNFLQWDWVKVYRTYFDRLQKIEESSSADFQNRGWTMDELVEKTMVATSDLQFMTEDSARIILSRGTRLVSKNPDLYVLTRDRRLAIYDFLMADNLMLQFCKNLTCDLLIIVADDGIRKLYPNNGQPYLDIYKQTLKLFELRRVTGHHHEHLNNPEKHAAIIKEFLSKSKR